MGMSENKRENGFTLIEALIAILILVVGLLAISQVFVMAMSSNAIANRTTAAAAAAAQQLDRLKAIPYGDARMQPGGSLTGDVANYSTITEMTGTGRVRVRWQITMVDANLRHIQVRAEVIGIMASLSRADLTTFRSCTAQIVGCP